MRRRDFIALVSNGVAAWPLGALAQEPGKTWRMGFIAQGYEKFYDALFDGLRDFGYTEGRKRRWEIEMDDRTVRVALERHWDASDASDFKVEHEIYREDAVLDYPQSGERIR